MKQIIANTDYDSNRVGGGDMRTALHTAAHEDDRQCLLILLEQKSIDTNVKTSRGLTPFLLAASKGKMVSFEVLLKDSRVDPDARDGKDKAAMELINALGKEIKANKAKELLATRSIKQLNLTDTTKLAILIENSEYLPNDSVSWDNLQGAKKDVLDMEVRLKANGYQVAVIKNAPEFLEAVSDVLNKTPVSSVAHLQVLYVGRSGMPQP